MKLFVAKNSEQILSRENLDFSVWGTPFQYIEDYLTYRTLIRNNSKFCDPSVYKCWYLVDNFVTDDYEGKIEKIFASCETFQMTSIFHQEQGSTYAFASVFVDENHRGKGYGNQLLQQVILKLKQEDSSCQAFILFSDIGPSMYMKIGFKPIKSFEWKFKSMELNVEVDILTKDEVKKLLPSILEVKDEEFSIVFSFEQLQWHWEQECAAFKVMKKQLQFVCGFQYKDAILLCSTDIYDNCLQAIVFCYKDISSASKVISAGQSRAYILGLDHLHIWEDKRIDNWSQFENLQGKRSERTKSSVPMIYPIKENINPENWKSICRAMWV